MWYPIAMPRHRSFALALLSLGLLLTGLAHADDYKLTPNVPIPEFQNKAETPSYDYNAPPKGIFREIQTAEGFEEELGFRRTHEIVPVRPTETFTAPAKPVFIVFSLFQHYESFEAMARCFPEQVDGLDPKTIVAQDRMYLALEDESGYLKLFPPDGGWKPGRYKVEIHIGWEVNQISLIGTMRFTVAKEGQLTTRP
jgi:hypothetical protein